MCVAICQCVDQLARRGIKRPFCSSTEDDLAMRGQNTASQIESQNATSPTSNGITLGHQKGFQQQPVHAYQNRFSKYSVIGKRGDRLGLGDQLLQLLHQWGQSRQSGLFQYFSKNGSRHSFNYA